MDDAITIRPATDADRARLGIMAGKLVRLHHAFDSLRFLRLDDVEEGYGRWLVKESANARAIVLVAERAEAGGSAIVGYLYGALAERSYNDLRDACGYVHDVWVEADARRQGTAQALLDRACTFFREKRMPRVVLMTASPNDSAQKLFAAAGFRSTMIEMTKEL
ncbi:hypothetical protein BH09MYX1_BH09MYX1_54580 [soil metagenome]